MVLYQHNKIAYDKLVLNLKTNQKACIIQPTGTGKSFIIAQLLHDNPNLNFLIISSTTYIKNQFINTFPDINNFNFITYHTLLSEYYNSIINSTYDYIIIDEFHRSGASSWNIKIIELLNHNPYSKIVGFTATPIRYLEENRNLPKELFDDNIVHNLSLRESFDKGILTRPKYISALYDIGNEYDKLIDKIKNCNKVNKTELLNNILESKLAFEKSSGLDAIFKKHIKDERNFIVFCSSIEHLNKIQPFITKCFKKLGTVNSNKVYSKLEDSYNNFESFKKNSLNSDYNLLFSVNLLNEGIHVPNVDGVIFIRNTESPIIYYQQLGRCLESKGKRTIVFDLVNNFKINKNNIQQFESDKNYNESLIDYNKKDYSDYIFDFNIIDEIQDINELFNSFNFDEQWEHNKDLLSEFITIHNRLPKAREKFKDLKIGYWVRTQQSLYKKNTLNQYQTNELLKINHKFFDILSLDESWEKNKLLLIEYINIHNKLPKYTTTFKNNNIGLWLGHQKGLYQKNILSEYKLNELLKIYPNILDKIIRNDKWKKDKNLLAEFITIHNRLPRAREMFKNFKIGTWLRSQQDFFQKGTISQYNKNELLKINANIFDRIKQDDKWEKHKILLIEYINIHNTLPQSKTIFKNINIGMWLSNQKTHYHKNILNEYKSNEILKLDPNIFDNIKENVWKKNKDLFSKFITIHNRLPKATEKFKNLNVGTWIATQQNNYDMGKLDQYKTNELLKIDPNILDKIKKNEKWEQNKDLLSEFIKVHNRLPQTREIFKNLNIGAWIGTQQSSYHMGKLNQYKTNELIKIDPNILNKI